MTAEAKIRPENLRAEVDGLIRRVETFSKEYLGAVRVLPRVDRDGHSDCPFAEELYARKEEWEAKLRDGLASLQAELRKVEEALTLCRRRGAVVEGDQSRLTGEDAKRRYADAQARLEEECEQYIRMRRDLTRAIETIGKALATGSLKQYPGRRPRRPLPFPLPLPIPGGPVTPAPGQPLPPPSQPVPAGPVTQPAGPTGGCSELDKLLRIGLRPTPGPMAPPGNQGPLE